MNSEFGIRSSESGIAPCRTKPQQGKLLSNSEFSIPNSAFAQAIFSVSQREVM